MNSIKRDIDERNIDIDAFIAYVEKKYGGDMYIYGSHVPLLNGSNYGGRYGPHDEVAFAVCYDSEQKFKMPSQENRKWFEKYAEHKMVQREIEVMLIVDKRTL